MSLKSVIRSEFSVMDIEGQAETELNDTKHLKEKKFNLTGKSIFYMFRKKTQFKTFVVTHKSLFKTFLILT